MTAVRVSVANGVARVVLDHPPLNILTRRVLADLRDALDGLRSDTTLRVLLLSASGAHFSAGADVAEHLPPTYHDLIPEFLDTIAAIDAFPVPVVAAVQGRCLGGGCELILGADMVIAAEGATFGQPEIVLGVIPPAACALLPRLLARGDAAALIFTGDTLTADEARRVGLVWRVVPDQDLVGAAEAVATSIARHSAAALRVAKRALRAGWDAAHTMQPAGELYTDELMGTVDATAGLTAFLNKRRPTWSHQ